MRLVAARAIAVLGNAPAAQHRLLLVARTTGDSLALFVVVRSMAAGAFAVTFEERRRRHDRLLGSVAGRTARARRLRARVLFFMARGAYLARLLARRRVLRRDLFVALLAVRRRDFFLGVRPVAGVAGALFVDHDRRRVVLARSMATHARPRIFVFARHESMALHAIGRGIGPGLLARLLDRVVNARFLRVALGALPRPRLVDLFTREIVALGAGDLLFDDMHAMSHHAARLVPGGAHVDAAAHANGLVIIGTGRHDGREQRDDEQPLHARAFFLAAFGPSLARCGLAWNIRSPGSGTSV